MLATNVVRAGSIAALSFFVALPAPGQAGPDVQVNQDPPGLIQNETSLVLNPTMPGNFVMAYNDDPYPPGCVGLGASFSMDGGVTWTDRQLALPPGMVDAFDPITAVDQLGNIYAGHVATDGFPGGQSGIFVHQSMDGGNTWPMMTPIGTSPANLNDKPHMVCDPHPSSPYQNCLYVAWIWELGGGPWSDIWFRASGPGGASFTPAVPVSDMPIGVGRGNGPNLAVASDGTIYLAWIDCDVTQQGQLPGTLYIDRSFDGGLTWGTDTVVRSVLTLPSFLSNYMTPLSDAQARSYPCIATNPLNPLDVYMVYAEDPDGPWVGDEANVYFIMSGDGGYNWSAPVALVPGLTFGHEFEPWIDVKPNGTIDVAWYMSPQTDVPPGGVVWWAVISRSTDGGTTWAFPVAISDQPFATPINYWGTPWMGEYLALTVDATNAYIGFTSSVNDVFGDVFFDQIDNSFIGAWVEPFSWYSETLPLPQQSNWEPWANDPTAGNFFATSAQARSAPRSVLIDNGDDAVYPYSGYDYGRWIYTAWSYVPSSLTTDQFFVLLNEYPVVNGLQDWSLQVQLDGATGMVNDNNSPASLPMVRDAWVEIRVEIDLDLDRQHVFYGGTHLVSKLWSEGVAPGGQLEIAAVDLFANGALAPVYYDDMSLREDVRLSCVADLNGDRNVGFNDLLGVLSNWGPCGACIHDVDFDGSVGFSDILVVLASWGPCP